MNPRQHRRTRYSSNHGEKAMITARHICSTSEPIRVLLRPNLKQYVTPSTLRVCHRTQVQTLYQQQTPHLQRNTQTHLDVWHSTLGHDLKFQHRNFGTFSVESLASDSECPLIRAKLCHPQGPLNTFSKRRNQTLQLPLSCSPPCKHQWTYRHTHRAANPQVSAPILAQRPAYQILAHCSTCNSCL
jgi:hypothetical protein